MDKTSPVIKKPSMSDSENSSTSKSSSSSSSSSTSSSNSSSASSKRLKRYNRSKQAISSIIRSKPSLLPRRKRYVSPNFKRSDPYNNKHDREDKEEKREYYTRSGNKFFFKILNKFLEKRHSDPRKSPIRNRSSFNRSSYYSDGNRYRDWSSMRYARSLKLRSQSPLKNRYFSSTRLRSPHYSSGKCMKNFKVKFFNINFFFLNFK